jgi:hypothetical protein
MTELLASRNKSSVSPQGSPRVAVVTLNNTLVPTRMPTSYSLEPVNTHCIHGKGDFVGVISVTSLT